MKSKGALLAQIPNPFSKSFQNTGRAGSASADITGNLIPDYDSATIKQMGKDLAGIGRATGNIIMRQHLLGNAENYKTGEIAAKQYSISRQAMMREQGISVSSESIVNSNFKKGENGYSSTEMAIMRDNDWDIDDPATAQKMRGVRKYLTDATVNELNYNLKHQQDNLVLKSKNLVNKLYSTINPENMEQSLMAAHQSISLIEGTPTGKMNAANNESASLVQHVFGRMDATALGDAFRAENEVQGMAVISLNADDKRKRLAKVRRFISNTQYEKMMRSIAENERTMKQQYLQGVKIKDKALEEEKKRYGEHLESKFVASVTMQPGFEREQVLTTPFELKQLEGHVNHASESTDNVDPLQFQYENDFSNLSNKAGPINLDNGQVSISPDVLRKMDQRKSKYAESALTHDPVKSNPRLKKMSMTKEGLKKIVDSNRFHFWTDGNGNMQFRYKSVNDFMLGSGMGRELLRIEGKTVTEAGAAASRQVWGIYKNSGAERALNKLDKFVARGIISLPEMRALRNQILSEERREESGSEKEYKVPKSVKDQMNVSDEFLDAEIERLVYGDTEHFSDLIKAPFNKHVVEAKIEARKWKAALVYTIRKNKMTEEQALRFFDREQRKFRINLQNGKIGNYQLRKNVEAKTQIGDIAEDIRADERNRKNIDDLNMGIINDAVKSGGIKWLTDILNSSQFSERHKKIVENYLIMKLNENKLKKEKASELNRK